MIAAAGPRGRALAAFAALCALAIGVSACGGSSHTSGSGTTTSATTSTSASTSSSTRRAASPRYLRKTVRLGRSGPSGTIRIASLGTLGYRCDRRGGLVSASLGGRIAATERVYVEGERHRHLRAGTVQPPPRLAVAGIRDRVLVWHIIQSTEGSTLDGIVSVRFGLGASGSTPGCVSVRWTSSVGVISHVGHWTAPGGWL